MSCLRKLVSTHIYVSLQALQQTSLTSEDGVVGVEESMDSDMESDMDTSEQPLEEGSSSDEEEEDGEEEEEDDSGVEEESVSVPEELKVKVKAALGEAAVQEGEDNSEQVS